MMTSMSNPPLDEARIVPEGTKQIQRMIKKTVNGEMERKKEGKKEMQEQSLKGKYGT